MIWLLLLGLQWYFYPTHIFFELIIAQSKDSIYQEMKKFDTIFKFI
jgi:hypothetical protein